MRTSFQKPYGWVIDQTHKEDFLHLAILKENASYRDFWKEYGGDKVRQACKRIGDFYTDGGDTATSRDVCAADYTILHQFIYGLCRFGVSMPSTHAGFHESLDALDPFNDQEPKRVPFFRYRPPIVQVLDDDGPFECNMAEPLSKPLKPSERLIKIDLSRKKGELLAEFKNLLEAVEHFRESKDVPQSFKENYGQWDPERTRFREEARQQLHVWRLRRQRKTYLEIKRITGLRVPAAKKSFAKAFELIEGRKYDPKYYRERYEAITKHELTRTCADCPERATCKDPCPDMLAFIDQDQVAQAHLLLRDLPLQPKK